MKAIMKHFLFAFVLLVGVLAFAGCGKKAKIVGSWDHSGYVYTFNEDGTGNYDAVGTKMEFTYEDKGDKVAIKYTGNTKATDYGYKIEGKKLIIKDSFGNDVEYTKK